MPKRYGKRRHALERIVRKYEFEPAQGKSIDGMLRLTEYLLARKLLAKQKWGSLTTGPERTTLRPATPAQGEAYKRQRLAEVLERADNDDAQELP